MNLTTIRELRLYCRNNLFIISASVSRSASCQYWILYDVCINMMIFQVFNCYSCLAVLSMNILSVDFSENLHT